jgi:hypothetical protein
VRAVNVIHSPVSSPGFFGAIHFVNANDSMRKFFSPLPCSITTWAIGSLLAT